MADALGCLSARSHPPLSLIASLRVPLAGVHSSGELDSLDSAGEAGIAHLSGFGRGSPDVHSPSAGQSQLGLRSQASSPEGRSLAGSPVVSLHPRGGRRRFKWAHNPLQQLEVYSRLLAADEGIKEVYAPFYREAVRMQLQFALSQHVTATGGEDVKRYFDLALNRGEPRAR